MVANSFRVLYLCPVFTETGIAYGAFREAVKAKGFGV